MSRALWIGRAKQGLAAVVVVGAVVLAWDLAVRWDLLWMHRLPGPLAAAHGAKTLIAAGTALQDTTATLRRIGLGFGLGASLGLILGLITGVAPRARRVLEPLIQIARPVPAFALVPLAILWLGVGDLEKVAIVAWASLFPVWVNTHLTIQRVPMELVWTGLLLGAGPGRVLREVRIPWSVPGIYAGVRVALGLAFAATVVAEMAGAETGLGYRTMASHQNYVYDQMVAAILFIGVVGALVDRVLISLVRLLFPWLEDASAV